MDQLGKVRRGVIGWRSIRAPGTITAVNELEEGTRLALDFGKLASVAATGARVVPVVLQDADSGEVLFVGFANEEALEASLRERIAVLWSTSRNELWRKGATSGDVLELAEIRVNCEQNSLLYLVRRTTGGACHTLSDSGSARPSCYYRAITDEMTLQRRPEEITPVCALDGCDFLPCGCSSQPMPPLRNLCARADRMTLDGF
jgi:phosphoribosyl-AMP cyclohydrolase